MAELLKVADLKPYTDYKCAGLPWLDAIPHHWEMVPNRALMREQREAVGNNATKYTLLSLTLRGVIARDMVNPKGKFPAQFDTYKIVKPNDFVFCLFDIDETPRGVGLSMLNGMITGAYDVFSPTSRVNPNFLYYYYLSVDQGKLMKPIYTGLRKTIPRGVFASLKAPLPQPEEQDAIVRFLGWATSRLDRAIRAKRKVIALLNEQKRAIIHHAVTRGLDPSTSLKPSGFAWFGDIPQHWEVRRLKSLVKESVAGPYGSSLTKSMYTQGGIRVYGQQQVIPDDFTIGDYYISLEKFAEMQRYRVFPGDVLVSVMGTVGRVAVVPEGVEPGIINPRLVRYRPDATSVLSRWLQVAMQDIHAQVQLSESSKGTTMDGLNMRILGNLLLLVPPLPEQAVLLDHIEKERAPLVEAIARLETEVDLLREYRTRLVSDVVTGKLDVREAALNLPDEASAEATEDVDTDLDQGEFEEEEVEA